MVKSSASCDTLHESTRRETRHPYVEYYIGNTDEDDRRNGQGENHWSGAESLEWHIGRYFRDTMHGYGDYRWRYKDHDGIFATYEGRFYANQFHGYGVMSYPDGRVFTGLFYKDLRWGPGIERQVSLRANVGLFRGNQIYRLAWRPRGPSVAPDLTTGPRGSLYLDPYRTLLKENVKVLGKANSAVELLKHCGADPILASEMWPKLYPAHCTNMESVLCHRDTFENAYYHGEISCLENYNENDEEILSNSEGCDEIQKYFAWNNNDIMIHVMKHSFQHDKQRKSTGISLKNVLSGPRKMFYPAAKYEYDCRNVLMSSYIGHISTVAQLINEEDVYADISDMLGNTALMYAVCGNNRDIIHFLVEAGANVDSFNDSCCTPLGVALMRYLCVARDIGHNNVVNALLPPVADKVDKATPQEERKAIEWCIKREIPIESANATVVPVTKAASKALGLKRTISKLSTINQKDNLTKVNPHPATEAGYDSEQDTFHDDRRQFCDINEQYCTKIVAAFNTMNMQKMPVKNNYLFEVVDAVKEIDDDMAAQLAKMVEKRPKKAASITNKALKGKDKSDIMPAAKEQALVPINNRTKMETERQIADIYSTILQLLSEGANPKLVRCPQPALLMAVMSGSPKLVEKLVAHGADINEKFPEMLNYSALDVIITSPLSNETVDMLKVLLDSGADVNHRLDIRGEINVPGQGNEPGPTLLHVLLAKKVQFEFVEEIRNNILGLLLQHNANPGLFYHGRSPVDIALTKSVVLSEIFINNPGTDLNAPINKQNQSILVKMFTFYYIKLTTGMNRFPVLTNLLLRGADPLRECYYNNKRYGNLFEYAKHTLDISSLQPISQNNVLAQETNGKGKKKPNDTKPSKSTTADAARHNHKVSDEALEFREALDLITECARLLHIRWLRAKLMMELIDVIYKYKHRSWNMIIKEHQNPNNVGLWLTTQRCFEIWDVLKTTNKKRYTDELILKHLLCIVLYYQKRLKAKKLITPVMTAPEKNLIESDVNGLLKEYRLASKLAKEAEVWRKIYVKPELAPKNDKKFKICFECSLPLAESNIICDMCHLVSFCDLQCVKSNVERMTCHPCSEFLMEKYFPSSPSSLLTIT